MKRRKLSDERVSPKSPTPEKENYKDKQPVADPSPAENGTTIHKTPTPPPADTVEAPVVRGPQITGGLDSVRPPRREPSDDLAPRPDQPADDSPPALSTPTGLDKSVDAVLAKIFASGLFERRDIDGRALDFLSTVSTPLALAALEDIQRRDFSTVRNKPAFIMSIFKRVVNAGGSLPPPSGPPPGGYVPTSVPASALAHLPPAVSDALQRVFRSGVCHPSQFDDRAMDILVDLQEQDAVRALSEFAAMEPGRVRNPSAFWMGLARKYKGHSRAPGGRMGPDSGGSGGYGSSSFDGGVDPYGRRNSGGSGGGGGYSTLDQRLDELSASGQLPRSVLDDRALDALRRLPEQDALGVLAELPEPARVRNMSAYVMGLCKKFAMGEARSLANRGGYGGGGYGGGGYGSGGYGGSSGHYGGGAYGGGYSGPGSGYGGGGYAPQAAGGYSGTGYGMQTSAMPTSYGGAPPQQHSDPSSRTREVGYSLDAMDVMVRQRFNRLTDLGFFFKSCFDSRAIGVLRNMRKGDACAALDELAASEPERIHNISAYFMGVAKRYRNRSQM